MNGRTEIVRGTLREDLLRLLARIPRPDKLKVRVIVLFSFEALPRRRTDS